eukprot:jgi/Mesvir1/796/Mv17390-RA.1
MAFACSLSTSKFLGVQLTPNSKAGGSAIQPKPLKCVAAHGKGDSLVDILRGATLGVAAASVLLAGTPSLAANNVRLPPLSTDPGRCERAYIGNTIGQANGVSDKLLDLRGCSFKDAGDRLVGKTLSAAIMAGADFTNANLTEVVLTKGYASGGNFAGANFSNAVLDRVAFDEANLAGANFNNAVLSGATFEGANLAGANFENAIIGRQDAQKLCNNPTLDQTARDLIGCRAK